MFLSCICCLSHAAWESIGPYGTPITALARAGSQETIIYASSRSNPTCIFKTTDSGLTWFQTGTVAYYVYSLAVDPRDENIVYASADGIVYKSVDGGATWTGTAVSGILLCGLALHPTEPARVYAVGITTGSQFCMGFFHSTDSGQTWTTTTLNSGSGQAHCLALDPLDPSIIYVGGDYYDGHSRACVFRSADGGQTFVEVSTGFDTSCVTVYSLAVHTVDPTILFAGTRYGGIYRSMDSGTSWQMVSSPECRNILSFATISALPDLVLAGADTTVYKSTDAGASWAPSSNGLGGLNFKALDIHPGQPAQVTAVNNSGIYTSTDAGASWLRTNDGINLMSITTFTVARISPSIIYAESDVGVFKANTNALSWTLLPHFLSCGNICAIATHNMNPEIVLALEGSG